MSESEPWPPPVTERKKPLPFAGQPVGLPDLRKPQNSARNEQPCARTRVHTRARSSRPTRSHAESRLPPWLAGNFVAQDAAMLAASQPHSLAQVWAHHKASAGWYEAGLLRWPRYAYGAVHTGLTAVEYAVLWWMHAPSRALPTLALVALLVFWPF